MPTPYTGVSIVDYLKSTGGDSSYTSRAAMAAKQGISNYTGTAAQNTQLLGNLRNSTTPTVRPPITTSTPIPLTITPPPTNPNISNQISSIKQPNQPTQITPQSIQSTQNTPDTPNPYEAQYQSLLSSSPEVDKAQQAIDNQNNSFRGGMQNISDKPIDMGFIRGQQASLEARNTNLQIPLQQQLANAQRQRQSSLDAVKFGLDRADQVKANANKIGEISPGASTYNAQGNIISTAPTNSAPRIIGSASSGYYQVGADGQTTPINTSSGSTSGTSSADIKAIQTQLNQNGANLKVDGILGPLTKAAMQAAGMTVPTSTTKPQTATQVTAAKNNDIASAVLDFQNQMRTKNWKGANPNAYNYYKSELIKQYGASAALALDAAMKKAGIEVDYGG